jgi:hypothetical protein
VHRRTFGPVKEEAEEVQRKLYHDGFHNLSTPIIMLIKMKENEMGRACSMHGSIRYYVKIFNLSSEWRRPLMHRWDDNIKINLLK